ncbi:MAG TPA: hypothetical protein VF423_07340 [Actinomycetes bacterium]
MVAVAGAARLSQALVGEPQRPSRVVIAVGLAVPRRRFVVLTVAVAGGGWVIASVS